ncbi:tail fiber domain-containing protein [Planctomycetota bacterium]
MRNVLILLALLSLTCSSWAQLTITPLPGLTPSTGDSDWTVVGDNMYATPLGDVGIGTSSPDEKLHVIGNILVEAVTPLLFTPIYWAATGTPVPVWLTLSSTPDADAGIHLTAASGITGPWLGTTGWNIFREAATANLYFQNTLNVASLKYPGYRNSMVIQSGTGHVGIGVDDPRYSLDVVVEEMGRQTVASFRNPEDISGSADIVMGVGGNGPTPLIWDWVLSASNGGFSIGSTNVFPPTLNLSSQGRLGISIPQPSYGLHLPNTTHAEGAGMANRWLTYSSKRWKTNVQTIDHPMDKVKQLRGVYFNWKEQGQRDVGLIAEEISQVMPEVVNFEDNGTDVSGVAYDRLVALLIEAVKEQDQKIEELEEKLSRQEQLMSRIEALEQAMDFGPIVQP